MGIWSVVFLNYEIPFPVKSDLDGDESGPASVVGLH